MSTALTVFAERFTPCGKLQVGRKTFTVFLADFVGETRKTLWAYTDFEKRAIVIDRALSPRSRIRFLWHELVHAVMDTFDIRLHSRKADTLQEEVATKVGEELGRLVYQRQRELSAIQQTLQTK